MRQWRENAVKCVMKCVIVVEMRHWRMALDIWVIITAMKSYGHMYIVETNFKGDRQVVAHFRS